MSGNESSDPIHLESPLQKTVQASYAMIASLVAYSRQFVTPTALALIVLPCLLCVFVYLSAMAVYVRSNWSLLSRRFQSAEDVRQAARELVVSFWDALGWFWFGYEVVGLEHVPQEGAALILYYHGALPVDYYYFVAKIHLLKGRVVHSVVDRFLFRLPGMKTFLRAFECTPGSVDSCAAELDAGHLLGLAPGGVYEAQFGDNQYELLWRERAGFARIALQARNPPLIIPMFTQNVRESFRSVGFLRPVFRWLYEKTRLPLVPLWGGFPVKLRTIVGEPIVYDVGEICPEELRDRCKRAMQKLIDDNQKKPGSVLRALGQRCGSGNAHNS